MQASGRVEVVRGRVDAELTEALVGFWVEHGALDEARARERAPEVLCVLRGPEDELLGTSSVVAARAPLIDRQMWMYRRFIAPSTDAAADRELLRGSFEALATEFTGAEGEPIGLCLLTEDRSLIERDPAAVWAEPELVFAGYTATDVHVRVGYFDGATI
jgi:hypothetical protein